ncbi:MAG TPA: tryptophan synthase subunit alpha [Tepidisphaeraceae bacterium]|jgi:tryptophan synthase alpha chain|nr:tryptophan synthase subunit alpha [Tepidisphaeraceae bacterium]
MSQSLKQVFEGLRARKRVGVLPFIPAGYPDLGATRELLPALEWGGASAIEVGIPFSDPIADGPVIQEAFTAALSRGLKLKEILKTVREARGSVSIPLVSMVSYSIVFRYGPERYFADARAAGFDGLILPDLPPPEAESICEKVRKAGLDTILLVAPTTTPSRRKEIASLCSGFIYYLSVSGITGERQALPEDLAEQLRQLKQTSDAPVCVGFGISKREHVGQLAGLADGAIVGSAIVRRMKQKAAEGVRKMTLAVEEYVRELVGT